MGIFQSRHENANETLSNKIKRRDRNKEIRTEMLLVSSWQEIGEFTN